MHLPGPVLSLATVLVLLAPAIVAPPAASAADDWRPEVTIAQGDVGPVVMDAAYRGPLAVVTWRDVADPEGNLRIAISDDAGRTFADRRVAQDVEDMAVAACRGHAVVAYRQKVSDGGKQLRLAIVPQGGGGITRRSLRSSLAGDGSIDVGCDTGLATVAWTERSSGAWRVLARHVRLADLHRTPVADLGPSQPSRVAAAVTAGWADVAWSDGAVLRLKRFAIGPGPSFPVSARPTQALKPNAVGPSLAADGPRLVVGYSDPVDAFLHLSDDRGATFGRAGGFGVVPGRTSVVSVGLSDRRIVGTLELTNGDMDPLSVRLSSRDAGHTWRNTMPSAARIRPIDGFLVTGSGTRLAETSILPGEAAGWTIVFRRER